jgi:hypothetical protein
MDPIPIISVPAPMVSTGRRQQDEDKPKKKKASDPPPESNEAADSIELSTETNDSDREPPKRSSDGILGTLIDVEA